MRKVTITFTKGDVVVMETVLTFEADYDGVSITGEIPVTNDDMTSDEDDRDDDDDRLCCYDEDGDYCCRKCSYFWHCNGCKEGDCETCSDKTCYRSPAYVP